MTAQWTDVTAMVRTSRVSFLLAPGTRILAYAVSARQAMQPRVVDHAEDVDPRLDSIAFDPTPAGTAALRARVSVDRLDPDRLGSMPAFVSRAEVDTRTDGERTAAVVLGTDAPPDRLVVRVQGTARHAEMSRVCVARFEEYVDRSDPDVMRVGMANNDQALLLGAGWSRAVAAPGGPVRYVEAGGATLVWPLSAAGDVRVGVETVTTGDTHQAGAGALRLVVNGERQPPRDLAPGWTSLEWLVPAGRLRDGTTMLTLIPEVAETSDGRRLVVGVGSVTVRPATNGQR